MTRDRSGYACSVEHDRPKPPFGLPSEMGELMAALLVVVDAWFELARESAPKRFQPSDRVEVLGLLVRLVARRFGGLRRVPTGEEVCPRLERDSVGLWIRSPGRVPSSSGEIEGQLARYGFRVEPTGNDREVVVTCHDLAGARVLTFPSVARRR